MTAPLAGVRAALVTALSGLGIPVHDYPAGALPAPCAWLVPGSPYLNPGAAWGSSEVGIDVRIKVANTAGGDAMQRLDALIDAAAVALAAAEIAVGPIGAPYTPEDSAALVADIPTSTIWTKE